MAAVPVTHMLHTIVAKTTASARLGITGRFAQAKSAFGTLAFA
jgi:hypothetical protein